MSFFVHRAEAFSAKEIALWCAVGGANVAIGLLFDSVLNTAAGLLSLACWGAVGWVKLWIED